MEMHDIAMALEQKELGAVLATIIDVDGHAYRKQGAAMALWQDGSTLGHLSPGCLETDLSEHVIGLLESGCSKMIDYDMRWTDDLSWGEAVGCGGITV